MTYRITVHDRFAAAGRRLWRIEGLPALVVIAAAVSLALLFAGCGEVPVARGSAVELAADANARAHANATAADQARTDAARAKGRADELERQALKENTQAAIAKAADARVDAAAAQAVAEALDKSARAATEEARTATDAARQERIIEAQAADDRAWRKFCRIIGLVGVAAGALIGGLLSWLISAKVGAPLGIIIAGSGILVTAFGATVSWLPLVLAASLVAGLAIWAWSHRQDKAVSQEGLTATGDALAALEQAGKGVEAEAVRQRARARQLAAGIHGRVVTTLRRHGLSRGDAAPAG